MLPSSLAVIFAVIAASMGPCMGQTTHNYRDRQAEPSYSTRSHEQVLFEEKFEQFEQLLRELRELLQLQRREMEQLRLQVDQLLRQQNQTQKQITDFRKCRVQLRSTGRDDAYFDPENAGHVAVNGVKIFNAVYPDNRSYYRGIHVVLLNRSTCTAYHHSAYDTHGDKWAAHRLVNQLNGVPRGIVILGISSDSAADNLGPAKQTLRYMGVDVDTLKLRDKVLFIVEKGTLPAIAVSRSQRKRQGIEYENDL